MRVPFNECTHDSGRVLSLSSTTIIKAYSDSRRGTEEQLGECTEEEPSSFDFRIPPGAV